MSRQRGRRTPRPFLTFLIFLTASTRASPCPGGVAKYCPPAGPRRAASCGQHKRSGAARPMRIHGPRADSGLAALRCVRWRTGPARLPIFGQSWGGLAIHYLRLWAIAAAVTVSPHRRPALRPRTGALPPLQFLQLLGLARMAQGLQHLVEFAVEHLLQLVQRQLDAVVGEPSLREVVGADAVAALATADQALAQRGLLGGAFAAFLFLQARLQHLQGPGLVAVLAAAVLAFGDDAGGQVHHAHG